MKSDSPDKFFILFAIIFLIPVIILIIVFFNQPNYNYILKNGIETTAEIQSGTANTSVKINDVHYYDIRYRFYDENNNVHFGRTSMTYTYQEIIELVKIGTITIKYDPKTFESIEASYNPASDMGNIFLYIMAGVFTIADIVLWVKVFKHKKEDSAQIYTEIQTAKSNDKNEQAEILADFYNDTTLLESHNTTCNYCGGKIKSTDNRCPHCNAKIDL